MEAVNKTGERMTDMKNDCEGMPTKDVGGRGWAGLSVIIVFVGMLTGVVLRAEANFLYTLPIKSGEEIKSLSDEALIEAYIDATVEVEAVTVFYYRAGFNSQREFDQYKSLLRYRTDLYLEIQRRKLQVPELPGVKGGP